MSFQPSFRVAIKTVALCANRLNMPSEIALKVGSYLNRQWWHDDRCQCWSYDCSVESMARQLRQKRGGTGRSIQKNKTCQPCSGCGLAWYCSKKCREDDFKTGHKKICGLPPWQVHCSAQEYSLHHSVFHGSSIPPYLVNEKLDIECGNTEPLSPSPKENNKDFEDDGACSDDGSWESIESAEDEAGSENASMSSRTRVICHFFETIKE